MRIRPQTVLSRVLAALLGPATIKRSDPYHELIALRFGEEQIPIPCGVRVGCVNDSIGGVIGGRDSAGNWGDSLHVDVYYRVSPRVFALSELNPCLLAYFSLPRTHAGSQWINPERPFVF